MGHPRSDVLDAIAECDSDVGHHAEARACASDLGAGAAHSGAGAAHLGAGAAHACASAAHAGAYGRDGFAHSERDIHADACAGGGHDQPDVAGTSRSLNPGRVLGECSMAAGAATAWAGDMQTVSRVCIYIHICIYVYMRHATRGPQHTPFADGAAVCRP